MQPKGQRTVAVDSAWAGATGHALSLALGTVVSGVSAYAYVALGTRNYGPEAFAPVAVVWSFWPLAAAAFGFPLEQWIARELATGSVGEARVHATVRRAAPAIVVVCLLAGAAAWAAGERLFGERELLYPTVLVAISIGAASMGVLRGSLAGRRRYLASATATALENLVRLAAAAAVLAADGDPRAYALMLVLGPFVGVLWPSAFRFANGPVRREPGDGTLSELVRASLLAQAVLAAPPLALAAMVGPTQEVTATFVALALLRAPYLVAVAVSVRALPGLTRRLAADARMAAVLLLRILAATVVLAGVAALVAPVVVPPILELIFGEGSSPGDAAVAGLTAGVVGAHGTLAASIVLLAAGRQRLMLRAWIVACAGYAAVLLLPIDQEVRVAVALAVAELLALLAMTISVVPRR